ncbi:uracil-DNA glycosylase family protein [Cypionkella psychrotolerans]|uniref:hypothetical protein n=1 Tax=Cypionkella psychrotolerans TaxID=1678131 RepID=UPI0006B53510|nr:hypothetical protein [Cypionkella psychrotolerans]
MKYDADILFNHAPWEDLIASQDLLFKPEALAAISDGLRMDFHEGHAQGRNMPVVPTEAYANDLLATFDNHVAGYDLPCLLSADRPTRGRVMFCAQDPLRNGVQTGITVGTFFGIDSDYLRQSRRHYGVLWQLIRRCVENGYDVWVTDAMKLYAKEAPIDPHLYDICGKVLLREVELFKPDHVVAFGNRARHLLDRFNLKKPVLHERHPTARGSSAAWAKEGAARRYCETPQGRLEAKVDRYCRDIFGLELPLSTSSASHMSAAR